MEDNLESTDIIEEQTETIGIPSDTDISIPDGMLDNVGGLLPLILIVIAVLGGLFGFNFLKNTKERSKEQAKNAKQHKENIKVAEEKLEELNKESDILIDAVNKNDVKTTEIGIDIQKNIDNTVKDIQQHNSKPETIKETKDRLKNALDKLGEK